MIEHHHHHRRHHRSGQEKRRMGVILLVLFAAVSVAGLLIFAGMENRAGEEPRSEMDTHFGTLPTMAYDGHTYRMKPEITPILLMGFDKRTEGMTGYRDGGQADFMMLVVVDHASKKVRRLQIDRDTIANVTVLGMTGNHVGTNRLQICLSHSFGQTPEENNRYAMEAVSNLLEGVPVELYAAMNFYRVGDLNHALGGVTVTMEDDFSALDPQMSIGATLKLTDEQAFLFVHERQTVSDGSNVSRMRRHRAFISAASDTILSHLRADTGYAASLMDSMESWLVTNMSRGRMLNEMNRAASYEILPIDTLEGEHTFGPTGLVEFYPSADSVMQWILKAYYDQIQ